MTGAKRDAAALGDDLLSAEAVHKKPAPDRSPFFSPPRSPPREPGADGPTVADAAEEDGVTGSLHDEFGAAAGESGYLSDDELGAAAGTGLR